VVLAQRMAEHQIAAEIVSADAMAVYRGMDIGTAKPGPAERGGIVHHLIDVADPSEEYTVARFQHEVGEVLADLDQRGVVPILVGGTGLYVRSIVDNLTVPGRWPEVRTELEKEPSSEILWAKLHELDPVGAAKMLPGNRSRVLRALEVTLGSGRPFSSHGPGLDHYPPSPYRQVGVRLDRAELDRRIEARYEQQMAAGFLAEVEALSHRTLSRTARQALGYRELLAHLEGTMTRHEALEQAMKRTRRFARRQERWFRRDPRIAWFDGLGSELGQQVEQWWWKSSDAVGG